MTSDPIADFITQLRNATRAHKSELEAPYSRIKNDLALVFKREGYIREVELVKKDNKPFIKLTLKSEGKQRSIAGVRRISSPGKRTYVGSQEVPRVLGGLGVAVLSTPQGVMSGHQARKLNVGGEVICYIW